MGPFRTTSSIFRTSTGQSVTVLVVEKHCPSRATYSPMSLTVSGKPYPSMDVRSNQGLHGYKESSPSMNKHLRTACLGIGILSMAE